MADEITTPTTKFENNRQYTHDSLVKQLNLMELHFKDGSAKECSCSSEKHLPTIEGLAEEAPGFTQDTAEKDFMRSVSDKAHELRAMLKATPKLDEAKSDEIEAWARETRKRIEYGKWSGSINMDSKKSTTTPEPTLRAPTGRVEPDPAPFEYEPYLPMADEPSAEIETTTSIPDLPPEPEPVEAAPSTFPPGLDPPIFGGRIYQFLNRPRGGK